MVSARLLLLSLFSAACSGAPCFGRLNATFQFEEVCYKVLQNGTNSLQLREFAADAGAAATLVTYNASDAITTYQEALELTSYYVIEYFIGNTNAKNVSLLSSRTVPFALRPPSAANPSWLAFMALAPSKWPASKVPPKPTYGVELTPLGGEKEEPVLLAVQHASSNFSPQPTDFDALCAKVKAEVAKQFPGYKIDEESLYSPTHARFYGYEFIGSPYEYECWYGVTKA